MAINLTVRDVRRRFGDIIFGRGRQYAEDGAVYSLKQENGSLYGQVMGSELYETSFELTPPYECACTCPYEGPCKHAAALALTWLMVGEELGGRPPVTSGNAYLRDRVGELGADEVRDLVMHLLGAFPEAEGAATIWLLRRDVEAMGVDPVLARDEAHAVRSELLRLLTGRPQVAGVPDDDEEWDEDEEEDEEDYQRWLHGYETERDEERFTLSQQVDALIGFIQERTLPESLSFRVLALAACAVELVRVGDGIGPVNWFHQIKRLVMGIGALIGADDCPDQVVMQAVGELLECYQGYFSGSVLLRPALVAAAAQPGRREWLLDLITERLESASGSMRETLYELLGEVQAEAGELRAALESLKRGRASVGALLGLASRCQRPEDVEVAVEGCRIAVATTSTHWDAAAVRDRAADVLLKVGDRDGARSFLMENFRASPQWLAAKRLLDTAYGLDERQELAAELVAQIGKSNDPEVKVRLHLEAGQPRLAVSALEAMREYMPDLHLEVARSIAGMEIEAAVAIWSKAIDHFIRLRNRKAYGQAARALVAMRKALVAAGQRERWQRYLFDLQVRYQTLRALREEMERAGV